MRLDIALSFTYVAISTAQYQTFITRPYDQAIATRVLTNIGDAEQASGYYFLSPYVCEFNPTSWGPHIFDNNGNLVWYGNHTVEKRALDLHVCDFQGAVGQHLCYNDAIPIQQGGHSSGAIRFFDNAYTQVATDFRNNGDLIAPDIHELNTPSGQAGKYLIKDVYQTVPANLSAYGGPANGYVLSGCFQVIKTVDRSLDFQWCSLDHVPLEDTYVYLHKSNRTSNGIAGTGNIHSPWDYFHINSIDRDSDGDYVVSGRHMNAIYKIAGKDSRLAAPGTLIWTLGGKRNEFDIRGFNFSRQHTVRFYDATDTTDTISFFDNGSDGVTSTSTISSGKLVLVDNSTMTASLVLQLSPPNNMSSASQGSMQALPNGNWLVGWGAQPYYTEYNPDGKILYHAQFGRSLRGKKGLNIQSYRAWKSPWIGRPITRPDIVAYAQNCSGALHAYVSWNGATEVTTWRFHTSASAVGPWEEVKPAVGSAEGSPAGWAKTGFETTALLSKAGERIARFVYAEALDMDRQVLRRTLPVMAFVPNSTLAPFCDDAACSAGSTEYMSVESMAWQC